MKKIIALGDYENAPYHPFGGVDEAIKEILGAEYEIICTDNYDVMCDLSSCDLFLTYADCWPQKYLFTPEGLPITGDDLPEELITAEQAAGLISYVANGGKFIVLHCGISLQARKELIPVMGGKFFHHPPHGDMWVRMVDRTEPISKDIKPFLTDEEPYQFEFDPYSDITILSEYLFQGKSYPHSWKKSYGKGEVVYLMGGHTPDHVREPGNAALLQSTVSYLLR